MQRTSPEEVVFLKVQFSKEEWGMLLERVGDHQPGAEAEYIHDTVMRILRRKKRVKKDVQP